MLIQLTVIIIIIALSIFIVSYTFSNVSFTSRFKRLKQLYEEKKYDVLIDEIASLSSKHKKDINIMWMAANVYVDQQQLILAMVTLQNIIEEKAYTPEITETAVRNMLAKVYEDTGNMKKAVEEYQMVVAINEQNYDTLCKIALACYKQKDYQEAQKYLTLAIAQNDTNPEISYLLADCYLKTKSLTAASQAIQKALVLKPSEPLYHYLYGKILYTERDFSNAVTEFEVAYKDIDKEHKDDTALTLANALYELENYDKASEYYKEVFDREDKPNEKLLDERYRHADTLARKKQFEAALTQWSAIKSLTPIYLDVDYKIKTYSLIVSNYTLRKALEMDILDYLDKHLFKILTLNGYVVTDHIKKSDTLIYLQTMKKFGNEGQTYQIAFAFDSSGHQVLQTAVNEYMEYVRINRCINSYYMSIGGYAPNIKKIDGLELIKQDRFEAIMEGVVSFSD